MEKIKDRRRWYLHTKIKKYTRMDARSRYIEVTDKLFEKLTLKQKIELDELARAGYNLQFIIE